jgi:hypothetical protein
MPSQPNAFRLDELSCRQIGKAAGFFAGGIANFHMAPGGELYAIVENRNG